MRKKKRVKLSDGILKYISYYFVTSSFNASFTTTSATRVQNNDGYALNKEGIQGRAVVGPETTTGRAS